MPIIRTQRASPESSPCQEKTPFSRRFLIEPSLNGCEGQGLFMLVPCHPRAEMPFRKAEMRENRGFARFWDRVDVLISRKAIFGEEPETNRFR
jgi:hypothetical protein